jgi:hypothetical protein
MHVRQTVADPVVGVNEAHAVGWLDLASKVRDVRAQRLSGVDVRRPPNLLQQRVVGQEPSAIL